MKQTFGSFGAWALGISAIYQYCTYISLIKAERNSKWEAEFRKYAATLIYKQQAIIDSQNSIIQENNNVFPKKTTETQEAQRKIWEEPLDNPENNTLCYKCNHMNSESKSRQ